MQTLGLSSNPQPTDNIFKRLLWPSIENQYDVDLIGQQGFWVCTIVGVMTFIVMVIINTPITGAVTAAAFFLGGCGVRQRSVLAASLVFVLYLVNFVGGIVIGSFGNPLIQLVVLMLLFANVRATLLSRRWMAQPAEVADHEMPQHVSETVTEKFSNRLPAALWPWGRYVFYPLATVLLLLTIVGLTIMKKRTTMQRSTDTPSSTQSIELAPPSEN